MHAGGNGVDRAVADFVGALVARTEAVLGEDLLAMALVGSLATGDAHPATSDIDVLVVVDQAPDCARRDGLADEIVTLGLQCPWAGVEYVVYQADAVRAPTYPLRYTLNVNAGPRRDAHVSVGGDPAHWFLLDVAMACQLAIPLRGPRPSALIAEPPAVDVLQAIHDALAWHGAHSASSPDAVLNACRSWRWIETHRWTSKGEAARWALARGRAPDDAAVIADALSTRHDRGARLAEDRVRAFLAGVARQVDHRLRH